MAWSGCGRAGCVFAVCGRLCGVRPCGVRPCGVRLRGVRLRGVRPCGVHLRGVRPRTVRLCPAERKRVPRDPVRLPRPPRLLPRLLLVNRLFIERFVLHSRTTDTPSRKPLGRQQTGSVTPLHRASRPLPTPLSGALLSSLGAGAESASSRNRPKPGPESPPSADVCRSRSEAWSPFLWVQGGEA